VTRPRHANAPQPPDSTVKRVAWGFVVAAILAVASLLPMARAGWLG